jgi:hypothetical protein
MCSLFENKDRWITITGDNLGKNSINDVRVTVSLGGIEYVCTDSVIGEKPSNSSTADTVKLDASLGEAQEEIADLLDAQSARSLLQIEEAREDPAAVPSLGKKKIGQTVNIGKHVPGSPEEGGSGPEGYVEAATGIIKVISCRVDLALVHSANDLTNVHGFIKVASASLMVASEPPQNISGRLSTVAEGECLNGKDGVFCCSHCLPQPQPEKPNSTTAPGGEEEVNGTTTAAPGGGGDSTTTAAAPGGGGDSPPPPAA